MAGLASRFRAEDALGSTTVEVTFSRVKRDALEGKHAIRTTIDASGTVHVQYARRVDAFRAVGNLLICAYNSAFGTSARVYSPGATHTHTLTHMYPSCACVTLREPVRIGRQHWGLYRRKGCGYGDEGRYGVGAPPNRFLLACATFAVARAVGRRRDKAKGGELQLTVTGRRARFCVQEMLGVQIDASRGGVMTVERLKGFMVGERARSLAHLVLFRACGIPPGRPRPC
jgi:hypothetical protein